MIDRADKIRLIFTKREPAQPVFRFVGISIERTGDFLIFSAFNFPRLINVHVKTTKKRTSIHIVMTQ